MNGCVEPRWSRRLSGLAVALATCTLILSLPARVAAAGYCGGYTYIEKSPVPSHKGRPLIHQAPYRDGALVLRSLSRRFIHCSPPTNVLDGGGYGNLEPLLVRRVTCTVGLKVATKRQCARHHTCVAANIHWTCSYKSIALETVRGWCHAPAGRQVKWTAGGSE